MKPFQNTGTILDEIDGEFRDDGVFVVAHWPETPSTGWGLLSKLAADLDREREDEAA